jgi:hypothetical protein
LGYEDKKVEPTKEAENEESDFVLVVFSFFDRLAWRVVLFSFVLSHFLLVRGWNGGCWSL